MFFTLWIIFPLSKSAPRAICAFIILSVSSRRIGIKRSAIDIIMEISCTGTWIFFNGPSRLSSASVSWFGVVVSVISEEPIIRKIRRTDIRHAIATPSRVIVIFQIRTSTSPGVNKMLNTIVIASSTKIDFRPFVINLNGTFDSLIITARNAVPSR